MKNWSGQRNKSFHHNLALLARSSSLVIEELVGITNSPWTAIIILTINIMIVLNNPAVTTFDLGDVELLEEIHPINE